MVDTSQGAIFGILDRLYTTILKIDDKGNPRTGMTVSIQTQGTPINPKDYAKPWTPFLRTGAVGDEDIPDDGSSALQAAYNTATLVDKKLGNVGGVENIDTTGKISTTWSAIITGATVDASQGDQKTPEELEKLQEMTERINDFEKLKVGKDEAGNPIYEDSPINSRQYDKYLEAKKAYYKAEEKYADAYADSLFDPIAKQRWPQKGRSLIGDVNDAMDTWNTTGKKVWIEEALDYLAAQGRNPTTAMVRAAINKFNIYQQALAGQVADLVPYSYITPTDWYDPDSDIWNTYKGKFTTSETHDSKTTEKWHAELKVNYGLFSGGANAKGSTEKVNNDAASQDTEISLKWAVVDINRPWLDTSLLKMGGWYLAGAAFKRGCISGGTPVDNVFLSCIPIQMILVCDVKVKNKAIQDHFDSLVKSLSVEANFSYGPFVSASGGYSSDEEKTNALKKMAREGLSLPGIQRIGWVSEVVTSISPQLDGH
jgi:hypothetical protein